MSLHPPTCQAYPPNAANLRPRPASRQSYRSVEFSSSWTVSSLRQQHRAAMSEAVELQRAAIARKHLSGEYCLRWLIRQDHEEFMLGRMTQDMRSMASPRSLDMAIMYCFPAPLSDRVLDELFDARRERMIHYKVLHRLRQ